jgi:hypothetical protein
MVLGYHAHFTENEFRPELLRPRFSSGLPFDRKVDGLHEIWKTQT